MSLRILCIQMSQRFLIFRAPVIRITASVCIRSKVVGCLSLSYEPGRFDVLEDREDMLEWHTLFKSAITPTGQENSYWVERIADR